jgi:hypothetical protein
MDPGRTIDRPDHRYFDVQQVVDEVFAFLEDPESCLGVDHSSVGGVYSCQERVASACQDDYMRFGITGDFVEGIGELGMDSADPSRKDCRTTPIVYANFKDAIFPFQLNEAEAVCIGFERSHSLSP